MRGFGVEPRKVIPLSLPEPDITDFREEMPQTRMRGDCPPLWCGSNVRSTWSLTGYHHPHLSRTPVRRMLVDNATVNLNAFRPSLMTEADAQFLKQLEALFETSKSKGSIWLNHKRRAVHRP